MRIQWISVEHLPPLEDVFMDCDAQVNLFIGPNASGKSTILRAIKDSISSWDEFDDENPYPIYRFSRGNGAWVDIGVNYGESLDTTYYPDGADCSGAGTSIWEAVPFLHIPAVRVNLPGMSIFDSTNERSLYVLADDALKRLFDTESGIFYGQYVEPATDSLRQEIAAEQLQQLRRVLEIGNFCAQHICSEVIYDDTIRPYVETNDDGINPPETVVRHNLGIVTSDDIAGKLLYAGALSSGTQGTLLWIRALALKMAHHYDWHEGWEKKPAILLIDEIENHLHPTWQRRVIPALLEHFPGLQIFATTHSPFVVAGLKAGQVHLLNRDENTGVVTHTRNTEDIIGWTADEILRTMMGVDDPTDAETAAAARELRQLRQEGPCDTLEAEEQRQQRMTELRQLVDRDLLAGGPMKARRELFEQQFAEALEKHLQSKNLNQENG